MDPMYTTLTRRFLIALTVVIMIYWIVARIIRGPQWFLAGEMVLTGFIMLNFIRTKARR